MSNGTFVSDTVVGTATGPDIDDVFGDVSRKLLTDDTPFHVRDLVMSCGRNTAVCGIDGVPSNSSARVRVWCCHPEMPDVLSCGCAVVYGSRCLWLSTAPYVGAVFGHLMLSYTMC